MRKFIGKISNIHKKFTNGRAKEKTGHDERSRLRERYSHEPRGRGEARRPKAKPMGAGDSRSAAQEAAGLLSGTGGSASREDSAYPERRTAPQDAPVARYRRGNIEVRPSYQKGKNDIPLPRQIDTNTLCTQPAPKMRLGA